MPIERISLTANNEFNSGWLSYILGQYRDPLQSRMWQEGWDTAADSGELVGLALVPAIRNGTISIKIEEAS